MNKTVTAFFAVIALLGMAVAQNNVITPKSTDLIEIISSQRANPSNIYTTPAGMQAGSGGVVNITDPTYGASATVSDNATALQAAINAAVAARKLLYIPAAYAGTSTTPVTITDNIGSGVTGC
jgi:hypothetical protein